MKTPNQKPQAKNQKQSNKIIHYHSIYTFDRYDTIMRDIFYADKDICLYYHLLGELESIQNIVKLERQAGGIKC